MTLKKFITSKLKKTGTLNVETIYKEFYKKPKSKTLQVSVSRALRELRDDGLIKRRHPRHSNIIELADSVKSNNEETLESKETVESNIEPEKVNSTPVEVNTEPEKETSSVDNEEKKPNLYVFGGRVSYIDPHEPARQKKSREIPVRVLATDIIEALRRAEIEIRKQSNGLEFSIMVLYGSAVTVYPPRKKE